MTHFDEKRPIPDLELIVLRGALQLGPREPGCARTLELLAGYGWRDHDHQVLYEVLCDLGSSFPQPLREWLAAAITRKGFPDFDLDSYFVPIDLTLEQLLDRVRDLTRKESRNSVRS